MEKNIFNTREDETIFMSSEGLNQLLQNYKPNSKGKNILWTTDFNI
jgi:hypothetical protein